MAIAVPSRFAVLSIEDDDYKPKKTPKTTIPGKTSTKGKNDKQKSQQHLPQQAKKDDKKKQNKGRKKKANNEEQQWEQWKQKDTMAVEEMFEQELHQAIILSKLAYEEHLQSSDKDDKEHEQNKKGVKKGKKATMSLKDFNNLTAAAVPVVAPPPESSSAKPKSPTETDADFFQRIEKETTAEISKGKEKDLLKARLNKIDDEITLAQLRVEVEKRDEVINELREEVESLRQKLIEVEEQKSKLDEIFMHGEMKDKAAILVEVAELKEIRDELTSEVASLHAQLEQERSKTRSVSADVKSSKQNNRKRPIAENA